LDESAAVEEEEVELSWERVAVADFSIIKDKLSAISL